MILPKEQSESVLKAWALKTDEQKQNALKETGQVVSALFAGENDLAQQYINNKAIARRNAGDEEGAKFLETWRGVTEVNPTASQRFFTAELLRLPGGEKIVENIIKLGVEKRAEAKGPSELKESIAKATEAEVKAANAVATAPDVIAEAKAKSEFEKAKAFKEQVIAKYAERTAVDKIIADAASLGLTKAQTNEVLAKTSKLGVETKQAALQLKALEATGGVDPDKKFTQEEKIRKEHQTRTMVYGELQGTFSNIKSSADTGNGPGDIALITSFMKMLDPGSVVRETEFATARDTAGLFTQLENRLQKAKDGQILTPTQRKQYVALAKQYLDSAQKKAGEEKVALGVIVKNYKLNPDNVFGPEETTTPVGGGGGTVNPPTVGQRNVTVNY
jgi:hypothetical protein